MKSQKFYYGWFIAVLAGLGLASSVAVFIPATIGLIAGSVSAEFGWSSQQIFIAQGLATAGAIVVAPFIGGLVDRFGARVIICSAFAVEALIIASFHWLDASITMFYARYVLLTLLGTGGTHVAFATVISRWFDRRRGMALGIALTGTGLGGVFWSLVVQALFDRYGWRDAYLYLAAMIGLVTLPIMLLMIRESPESMGLNVDGDASGIRTASLGSDSAALSGLTLREAVRTSHYWLMFVIYLLVAIGTYSVMVHMVPFLKGRGESAQTAAAVQASLWAVLVVGRFSAGWLMDRFFAPYVAIAFLILPIVGISLLASGAAGPVAFVAAMLVGLAAGAEVDVVAYLAGRYFGLAHFALIYATFYSAFSLGAGIGPAGTAWAVARFGGYGLVFWIIAGILGLAAVLLLCLPKYKKPELAH